MPKIVISLNPAWTPTQNAQHFYKLYQKAKTAEIEVAKQLEMTKADIFRLESAEPYPAQYKSCTVVAKEERDNKIYRKIKSSVNLDGYETIFIGVPVWWHTCPMIVQGWILQNQKSFEGKTVIPFCTYASTFRDETLSKITELTPKSIHKKGLGLTNPTKQDVKIWLDSIKK